MSIEELLSELQDDVIVELYILDFQGVASLDAEGRVKDLRRRAAAYAGYEVAEIYKRPYTEPKELEIFVEAA